MTNLDTTFVRDQFPAFAESGLKDWAFFDNAGGSYTCKQVIQQLNAYYIGTKVQPYHAYPIAQKAGEAMDASYASLAEYLNVSEDEVHLGPSTSQNTYVLAHAFQDMLVAGDEIIVTNQDHEANSGAWRRFEQYGVVIREWEVDPITGGLDQADLDSLLNAKTRIIAYPQCSNIVAEWNPVREINAKAHNFGAICIVDGVAAAPHGLPDITDLDADIYLFSLYKTWGPHLGLMTIRSALLDQLANQGHFFHKDMPRKKILPAGPDHAQIAASKGVIDYLDAVYQHHYSDSATSQERSRAVNDLFKNQETNNLEILLHWLQERDDVRILGPADATKRAPTVSILPLRKSITEVQSILTDQKLMTGVAHFYAPRLLTAMNLSPDKGVLRMSFLHYTTEAEVHQLIQGLQNALDQ